MDVPNNNHDSYSDCPNQLDVNTDLACMDTMDVGSSIQQPWSVHVLIISCISRGTLTLFPVGSVIIGCM